VDDIRTLLNADAAAAEADLHELWDSGEATVKGGVNWAREQPEYAEILGDGPDALVPEEEGAGL
jgi:hypothetical protein